MTELIILSIALSMDAFAVALGIGSKQITMSKSLALKVALFFGFFQGFMPLVGYFAGLGLSGFIESIDHWVAFILLAIIGGKMIYDSYGEPVEEEIAIITNKVLLLLAIATSIDAMAAGFTLHLFDLNVYLSLFFIGIITFLFSILGVYIGQKGGDKYETKAELLGGIVLILIGFKILLF